MGVRGLYSYMRRDSTNFAPARLHDTFVVIDGFNIVNCLYLNSTLCTQFNGEYLAFGVIVEKFISNLRKCLVEPLFVFDGVHAISKLEAVLKRARDRLETCRQLQCKAVNSNAEGCSSEFRVYLQPSLTSDTLVSVLDRLGVRHITANHEADQLAVSLAVALHCPVVSNDSDFFILGPYWSTVDGFEYIPFDLFDQDPRTFGTSMCAGCAAKADRRTGQSCFFLEVQRFVPNAGIFRNLPPPQRPIFAVFCGNDYIPPHFFDQYLPGAPKQPYTQPKPSSMANAIARNSTKFHRVISWLSGFGNDVQQPVERMLSKFPLAYRNNAAKLLFDGLHCYAIDTFENSCILQTYLNSLFGDKVDDLKPVSNPAENTSLNSFGARAVQILKESSLAKGPPLTENWKLASVNAFRNRHLKAALLDSFYSFGIVNPTMVEDVMNRESAHACTTSLRQLYCELTFLLETGEQTLNNLPGLRGSVGNLYFHEYTRLGTRRFEKRRFPIAPPNDTLQLTSGSRQQFLIDRLGIPPPSSDHPPWIHGLACVYFLWIRFDSLRRACISTSAVGLAMVVVSVTVYSLFCRTSDRTRSTSTERISCHINKIKKRLSERKLKSPLLFHALHAFAQIQSVYYHLLGLAELLDTIVDIRTDQQTCISLPPPELFFPSGYLVHELSVCISQTPVNDRLTEVCNYWLPLIIGSLPDAPSGSLPTPTAAFLAETTQRFRGVIELVDSSLAKDERGKLPELITVSTASG